HQTEGRGRLGRRWWDEPGQSLLVSVLLRPVISPAHAPQISLVAGLAVTDALQAEGVTALIRWPNDILVGGRKICGILAEAASGGGARVDHVLVGIGVNLDQTAFPAEIAERATSLRLITGRAPDREAVLGALLAALDRRYGE